MVISGLVIPAEWNETGEVMAVSIAAFDENKYAVVDNSAGKELLNYIGCEVLVVGSLQAAGSKRYLTLSDFFCLGAKAADRPIKSGDDL